MPETFIVADVVDSTNVDSNGKGHHGRGKAKNHRSRSGVPGGEEIKSPKRKVVRVESEETQDFVREAESTNQEEVEGLSFVPSAISVLQKMMFRCNDQCSKKALSFWQLASVVIKEGEDHTRPTYARDVTTIL